MVSAERLRKLGMAAEAFDASLWEASSEEWRASPQELFMVWEDFGLVTPHRQHRIETVWA